MTHPDAAAKVDSECHMIMVNLICDTASEAAAQIQVNDKFESDSRPAQEKKRIGVTSQSQTREETQSLTRKLLRFRVTVWPAIAASRRLGQPGGRAATEASPPPGSARIIKLLTRPGPYATDSECHGQSPVTAPGLSRFTVTVTAPFDAGRRQSR